MKHEIIGLIPEKNRGEINGNHKRWRETRCEFVKISL